MARLFMNLALIQDGYLPAVVLPILRGDYLALFERAHRDDRDFVEFIAEREYESQNEILRLFQIPFPKEGRAEGERDRRRQSAGCRDVFGVFSCM